MPTEQGPMQPDPVGLRQKLAGMNFDLERVNEILAHCEHGLASPILEYDQGHAIEVSYDLFSDLVHCARIMYEEVCP